MYCDVTVKKRDAYFWDRIPSRQVIYIMYYNIQQKFLFEWGRERQNTQRPIYISYEKLPISSMTYGAS